MPRLRKDSPRYQAAVRRTEAATSMRAANEQLGKENKIRVIVGQAPQTLGGGKRRKVPFQR